MAVPLGTWDSVLIESKVVAVHAHLLHTGKVLLFHARATPIWSRLFDPESNTISADNQVVPNWPKQYVDPIDPIKSVYIEAPAIFCSGHCFLRDGKLLVAGGERPRPIPFEVTPPNFASGDRGLIYTFIFNPSTEEWEIPYGTNILPHRMADGRWYPTLAPVGEPISDPRRVLAISGWRKDLVQYESGNWFDVTNDDPELYNPSTGWEFFRKSTDPETYGKLPEPLTYADKEVNYPGVHVVPFGIFNTYLFIAAPSDQSYFFDWQKLYDSAHPTVTPYTRVAAASPAPSTDPSLPHFRYSAPTVLFPLNNSVQSAKVMIIGGMYKTPAPPQDPPLPDIEVLVNTTTTIELNSSAPHWTENTETLHYARVDHNAVILPDSKILVVGGNTISSDAGSILTPELYDMKNTSAGWSDLPNMQVGRNYHSTALLLPDGRVFVAGGRVRNTGDLEDDTNKSIEIFSPGYLLDGAQPELTDLSTEEVNYNTDFTVNCNMDLDSFVLIRPSSVTHGNNMEQRLIDIDVVSHEHDVYTLTSPVNASVAPPGYYMLFGLTKKEDSRSGFSNIPSVALWIKIDTI